MSCEPTEGPLVQELVAPVLVRPACWANAPSELRVKAREVQCIEVPDSASVTHLYVLDAGACASLGRYRRWRLARARPMWL
eukprot:scaffold54969_cov23-Tisochrysis_lutea.AAC.1